MPLPPLTHLQFAIIDCLGAQERSGEEVRAKLAREHRIKRTLSAFYMLMKRLEDAGFVKGRAQRIEVDGYTGTERHYKVLGKGLRAWKTTRDWYPDRAAVLAW